MSGRKVVTLDERKYEELVRKARQAESLRREVEERERRARERAIGEFRPLIEDLYRRYEGLSHGLTEAERRLREEWQRERDEILRRLESSFEEVREVLKRHDSRIAGLESEFEEMRRREENRRELAERLRRMVAEQLEALKQLPHERFVPGKVNSLDLLFSMQESSIAAENYEAAIAGLQNLYVQVIETQEEVRRKERDYLIHWANLLERLEALKGRTEVELNLDLDVIGDFEHLGARRADFWVEGRLGEVGARIDGLVRELQAHRDDWTREDLKKRVEEKIPALEESVEALIDESVERAVFSEERRKMAKNLSASAERRGFTEVVREGFMDEDPRGTYVILKRNALGDELVIKVADPRQPELNFYPRMGTRDRATQETRMTEIVRNAFANYRTIRREDHPDQELIRKLK